MATPVAHYLVGLSISRGLASSSPARKKVPWLAVVAVIPDLDVLPGLLVGDLGRFHHGPSHALLMAVVFALVGAVALDAGRWRRVAAGTALLMVLYASHAGLDYFTGEATGAFGVPLLWPWTSAEYQSSVALLPQVQHSSAPLISIHNLLLIIRELFVFLPLAGLVYSVRSASSSWRSKPSLYFGGWFLAAMIASTLLLRLE